jgi:hypothetical protein
MQVLEIEDRSVTGLLTMPSHNKVVVTCRAVGIADIETIDNPHVWGAYGRDEYLVCNVKVRPFPNTYEEPNISDGLNSITTNYEKSDATNNYLSITNQLISDYQSVRDIYSSSQSIASNELPPYARAAIETMPIFTESDILIEIKFWAFIETWQMLCNTIRQAKRNQLSSMVNELSVEVAMRAEGPLQLPVKRSSLPEDVQRELYKMEQDASRDFMELGMDPVLDFQQLMVMDSHWDRVVKMSGLVRNELVRLEAKESLIRALLEDEYGIDFDVGRRSGFS